MQSPRGMQQELWCSSGTGLTCGEHREVVSEVNTGTRWPSRKGGVGQAME